MAERERRDAASLRGSRNGAVTLGAVAEKLVDQSFESIALARWCRRRCWRGRGRLAGRDRDVARQGFHRQPSFGRFHEVVKDARRQSAAGGALHRRIVVVSDPYAANEVRREADEPGVAIVLCRGRVFWVCGLWAGRAGAGARGGTWA